MAVATRRRADALLLASLLVPPVLLGALALAVTTRLPLWRDEMATLSFALLDPAGLLRALGHVDAVTGPYYALELVVQRVVPGAFGLRLPSLLAALGCCVLVTLLARRWWGPWAGLAGGVAFALNPTALTMAVNARPYALATFCIALALWLLDRAGRIRHWVAYAAVLAAAGLLHLLALAVVPAFLAFAWGSRRRVVAWILSTAAAGAVVLPLALAGFGQRAQISWIPRQSGLDTLAVLTYLLRPDGDLQRRGALALAALVLVAILAAVAWWRSGDRVRVRQTIGSLLVFVVPWLVLLIVSSIASPVLVSYYLTPACLAVGLVIGSGAGVVARAAGARRRWWLPLCAVLAVLCLVPVVFAVRYSASIVRSPGGVDDFPALAARMRAELRPGDRIVVFQPYEQGGVAAGIARYSGDDGWFAELLRQLPDAEQPRAGIRTVEATDPLRTVEGGGSGRIWFLYVGGSPDPTLRREALHALGCAADSRLTPIRGDGDTLARLHCAAP